MRYLFFIALLALTAGCLSSPWSTTSNGPPPLAEPAWAGPAAIPGSCADALCFEPTFAVAPEGTAVVLTKTGFHVSHDLVHWTQRSLPPLHQQIHALANVNYTPGDGIIQFAPNGTLYFSALVFDSRVPLRVPTTLGIVVAWSTDLANHWTARLLALPNPDPSNPLVADRQWLAFGQDRTVYLSYQQVPSGIWMARSDDGGVTWGDFVLAIGTHDKLRGGYHGQPVVAPDGTLAFPVGYGHQVPGAYRVGQPGLATKGPQKVQVVLSRDHGSSFQIVDAAILPNGHDVEPFPQMAVDTGGGFHVAWSDYFGGVWTASSVDGGKTWMPPLQWDASFACQGPWIEARGTEVRLFWFPWKDGCNAATAAVPISRLLEGQAGGTIQRWSLGRVQSYTDFVHGAASNAGFIFGWSMGQNGGVAVTRLLTP